MTTNEQMNKRMRAGQSAPSYTAGGEPDRESSSMKVSAWMREQKAERESLIPTSEVMTNADTGEEQS